MPVTHTDYKISGITVGRTVATVRVRFYTGEYVNVDHEDGRGLVREYQRTGGIVRETVFRFSVGGFSEARFIEFLNSRLDRLNALTNIPEQVREVEPTLPDPRSETSR